VAISARLFTGLSALFSLLVGLLLVPRLLLFAGFNAALLAWPWQFDYDEGVNLHAAALLAGAQNIYLPNPPDHFISAPYPPMLYLLSVPLIWLGGVHLAAPRVLLLLATLAVGGLLVVLARRTGAGWPQALLPGALWLSISPVIIWATLYKQDMLGLAWGLAGLAVVLRWPDSRRHLRFAILFFAFAFFTKQSALAPAAAAVVWLFLRDRRAGLRFAGGLAAALAGGFLLLLAISRGGFWQHAITYQQYPWLLRFWQRLGGRLVGEYWPLLLIGGAAVIWAVWGGWRLWRPGPGTRDPAPASGGQVADDHEHPAPASIEHATHSASHSAFRVPQSALVPVPGPWALAVLYAGAATGSVMIQMGYAGANYNHLLDIFPPLCWLLGGALGYLGAVPSWPRRAALLALYGGLAVQAATLGGLENWYTAGYWPSPIRASELESRSALVRSATGPIYSEDAMVLLLNGRDLPYDDPDTIATMGDNGGWNEVRFVQDLRDRRFPYIFVRHGAYRWSARAGQAFEDAYDLTFQGTLDVYKPKVYPAHAQYTLDCALGRTPELRLMGYSLGPGVAANGALPGSDLHLALHWRALRPAGDYATFVHLLDAGGRQVAARDNPHSAADRPTSRWPVGGDVTEITDLPLPQGLAPGPYHLIAGVYGVEGGTITAVPVSCPVPERRVGDAIDLGAIQIH
jgi:hypothetical protein